MMTSQGKYTCQEYRLEMMLLGLRRQMDNPHLPDDERRRLAESIRDLEAQMGMD